MAICVCDSSFSLPFCVQRKWEEARREQKSRHFIPRILHSEMHTIAVISPLCKKGGSCIRESDQYNLNLVEGEDSKGGLISLFHIFSLLFFLFLPFSLNLSQCLAVEFFFPQFFFLLLRDLRDE